MLSKWPKTFPPLTAEQKRINDDFVKHWHEVLPKRFSLIEKFNHGYPVKNSREFVSTLEIGAGLGQHLEYEHLTQQQRENYVAVDIRPNMVDEMRRRYPDIKAICADCQEHIDYPDGSMDRLIAIHVLEHLPNLPRAVEELHRLCNKSKGRLLAVIPCEGSAAYTLARRISAQRIFEKRYGQSYDWFIQREHINLPHEIFEEIERCFVIDSKTYFPFAIPSVDLNLVVGLSRIRVEHAVTPQRCGRACISPVLAVGAATAALYFGVFALAKMMAADFIAVTAAYIVAVAFHYVSNRSFTFRSAASHSHRAEFSRYARTLAISYAVNVGTYALATHVFHSPVAVALVVALALNTSVAFVLMHIWVFRSPGVKALVTGAAGFIASNLVDRLLSAGHQVVGYDNFSTGQRRFVEGALTQPGFRLVEGDVLDEQSLKAAAAGCDTVFHFAANADVRFGTEHPRRDLEQNTIATFNVLEAMRANGVRRIAFSSTGSVYGEAKVIPTPEDAPFPVQTSLYGASKLAGEGLIAAYCEGYGFQGIVFRFVSILGERYTHGHVFDFYKKLRADPTRLPIRGNGQQRKSYLYIQDCIDAILLAFERTEGKYEVYNLGTDDSCQVNDSIGWICERLGVNPERIYSGGERGWIGDSPIIQLDTTKIRSLGWTPKLTIREGVLKTIDYLQAESWVLEQRS